MKAKASQSRRVVALIVLVIMLAGLAVWWLLQDDATPRSLHPPVTQAGNLTKANAHSDAGIIPPNVTLPELPGFTDRPSTLEAPNPVFPSPPATPVEEKLLYTVDGELMPTGLLTMSDRGTLIESPFSLTVTGKVSRADGTPVVGASVSASGEYLQYSQNQVSRNTSRYVFYPRRSVGTIQPMAAVSGEDGSYKLAVSGIAMVPEKGGFRGIDFAVNASATGLLQASTRSFTMHEGAEEIPVVSAMDIVMCAPSTVSGRVLWGGSDAPAAGASVALTRTYNFGLAGVTRVPGTVKAHSGTVFPGAPLANIVGANGEFEFSNIHDGVYQCWAVWPGTTHAQWRFGNREIPDESSHAVEVTVKDGAMVEPITLRLFRETKLTFRTNPLVQEVSAVELRSPKWARGMLPQMEFDRPTTSYSQQPDGSWVVAGLLPFHVLLRVKTPGWQESHTTIAPIPNQDLDVGTIDLSLGAIIEGRVVDESGRAIEGATVELIGGDTSSPISYHSRPANEYVLTSTDGGFRFTGLWQHSYRIAASKTGSQSNGVVIRASLDKSAVIEIVLATPDALVLGRIELESTPEVGMGPTYAAPPHQVPKHIAVHAVEAESDMGKKVQDGKSFMSIRSEQYVHNIQVAPDWTFRGAIKSGRYKLFYTYAGEYQVHEVEVTSGSQAEAVFRFGRSGGIRGRVVGLNGEALAGANVVIMGPMWSGNYSIHLNTSIAGKAVTKDDGSFEVTGLKAGDYLAWLPAYPQYQSHPSRGSDKRARASVATGKVAEVVIDMSDAPKGAAVFLTTSLNGKPRTPTNVFIAIDDNLKTTQHTGFFPLPDGRHLAIDVPVGKHAVTYSHYTDDYSGSVGDKVFFDVVHGEKEIHLTQDTRTVSITGTVIVPADLKDKFDDVRILAVRLTERGGASVGTNNSFLIVERTGAFGSKMLVAGWYRFELSAPGRLTSFAEVEVMDGAKIHLEFGMVSGSIRLVLDGVDGLLAGDDLTEFTARSEWVEVDVHDDRGSVFGGEHKNLLSLSYLLTDSKRMIETVPSGRVYVKLSHPMASPLSIPVDVLAGQATEVKLRFQLGPRLSISVPATDLPNPAPKSYWVRLRPSGQTTPSRSVTLTPQPDGSLAGHTYVAAPGVYDLISSFGKATPDTGTVTLSGPTTTHTLRVTK